MKGKVRVSWKVLIAVFSIMLVLPCFSNVASASRWSDETESYKEALDFMESKGLNGRSDGTFGINLNITRVDAAVMLVQVLGLDIENAPSSGFKDVPQRAVKHVNALKERGITQGKTATSFNSNAQITRGELAIWIQRAFDLKAKNTKLPFKDAGGRYTEAIAALYENDITKGASSTKFGTDSNAKRGDFAKFLYKANQKSEDLIDENYIPNEDLEIISIQ